MQHDVKTLTQSIFHFTFTLNLKESTFNLHSSIGTSKLCVEPVFVSQGSCLEFIELYCMSTVLYLILLVSEIFMVRQTKVEVHVLNKVVFITNNFVKDVFRGISRACAKSLRIIN